MNENDIIAKYVKENHPYLLDTIQFKIYKLSCAAINMVDAVVNTVNKLTDEDLKEIQDMTKGGSTE